MAMYYVSKISGTIRYKSGAWATVADASAASISAVLTAVGAGHTVVLDGGILGAAYAGADIGTNGLASFAADNQTLRGPVPTDPDYSEHCGVVQLNGSGSTNTAIIGGGSRVGWKLQKLTITNAQTNIVGVSASGSGTVEHCWFKDNFRHIKAGATAGSTTHIKNNGFLGDGTPDASELLLEAGTGTVYIENNLLIPGAKDYGPSIAIQGTGTYYIINNLFAGIAFGPIQPYGTPASGIVVERGNRVIAAGCKSSASGSGVYFTAGQSSTVTNNALSVSAVAPGATVSASTADVNTNNNSVADPYYIKSGRAGYFVASLDDAVSTTFDVLYGADGTDGLVAAANDLGIGVTWYCDSSRMASIIDDVLWARDNGVEIGAHTRTHSDITASGKIFDVSPGTVTIDRAANTITYSAGGTVTGFRAKTLAAIKAELEGFGATITGSAIYNISAVTTIQSGCLGEAIANGTSASVINILVGDATQGYVFSEVSGCVDEIEAVTGETVRSFAYPFGAMNSTVHGIIRQIKSGQITSARYTSIDTASSQHIASLNRYAIGAFNVTDVKSNTTSGDETADIKANINGLMAYLSETGSIASTYAHGVGDLSIAQWQTIIGEVVKWRGKVTSKPMGDAIADITAFATDDGDGTLSHVWPENAGDYRLLPQSPCIGAGIDVGLTTDADGNAVPGALGFDIGPYSYMPGWTLFDGTMPPLCLAAACPGKLKQVQEWRKLASAKEIGKY